MESSGLLSVEWSATSPESGRYSGTRYTTGADLLRRLGELRNHGAGYCEIRLAGHDYPTVSVAFRGAHAVIMGWTDEEHMALLGGDGSVPADDHVEVPIMDDQDMGGFTGEFVSSVAHAFSVLEKFLHAGDLDRLGDWFDL
jgi:hypothetical protein